MPNPYHDARGRFASKGSARGSGSSPMRRLVKNKAAVANAHAQNLGGVSGQEAASNSAELGRSVRTTNRKAMQLRNRAITSTSADRRVVANRRAVGGRKKTYAVGNDTPYGLRKTSQHSSPSKSNRALNRESSQMFNTSSASMAPVSRRQVQAKRSLGGASTAYRNTKQGGSATKKVNHRLSSGRKGAYPAVNKRQMNRSSEQTFNRTIARPGRRG